MATQREEYRRVAKRIDCAERKLIEALNLTQAAGLRFASSLERLIASVENLRAKVARLSNGR